MPHPIASLFRTFYSLISLCLVLSTFMTKPGREMAQISLLSKHGDLGSDSQLIKPTYKARVGAYIYDLNTDEI